MYCPQAMHPQAMQKVFSQHYYSSTAHARNRRVTATGNSIKCSVPGLKNDVEIPFPDRKLPVCKRCKKIYKTRELCRVRDKHTEVPWSTTYICVTLDESCFTTRNHEDGGMKLVEEGPMQFVARSIPGPPAAYCSKSDALCGGTKSPICMACKDKNYTRHHCRVKNKHLELPWSTVYVILSAIPAAPGSAGFFDSDSKSTTISKKRSASSCSEDEERSNNDEPTSKKSKNNDGEASSITHKDSDSTDEDGSSETEEIVGSRQTIQQIHSSKAFLLTVGKDDRVLAWLNMDPSSPPEAANNNAWSNQPPMDNMYAEQPPAYYNNGGSPPQGPGGPSGPPQNWSGYNNNGYFPNSNGNGMHPNVMPPPTNAGGAYGNNSMYGHGQPPNHHMQMPPNGRSTPNDFNSYQQQQHPAQPPHAQMKPNMYPGNNPGQQMPYQQNYTYEDRENQASLMNQGPPGPPPHHHMNNYPNKPFHHHHHGNDGGNGYGNDGASQGPPRGSPAQEYLPNGNPNPNPEHMMHNGTNRGHSNTTMPALPPAPSTAHHVPHPVPHPANGNHNIPPPHDHRRDQGYNGGNGNSYHGFSRRENYNAPPPAMNGPGGYGGGNGNSMPFYR